MPEDVVTVVLPQVAGTGHVWRVVEHGAGLELVSSEDHAGTSVPGAAGRHEVRLRAQQVGAWSVTVALGRPWEESRVEERRLTVHVE